MVLFFALVLLAAPLAAADLDKAVAEKSFKQFAINFPSAFWEAGDAFFKSLGQTGHSQSKKDFTRDNQAIIVSLKLAGPKTNVWVGVIKLEDKSLPEEYWKFNFVWREGSWKAHQALKFINNGKIDLYVDDLFTPSMKPFVEKEIEKMQAKR